MSDLYTPRPEHQLLERFAGEWRFEKTSAPGDGSPSQKVGSGEMKAELLGEFFVICRWSGDLYETEFDAFQTLGFDVDTGEYAGSWVDSLMNYRWHFNGSLEAEGNELVIEASGPGPDGEAARFRERYRFNSADSVTVVGEMLQDETWVPFMTTELTRSGSAI